MATLERLTTLTGATCGYICWYAREDVCRCSCGGERHGVLRDGTGDQPRREAKIQGRRYVLAAVSQGYISPVSEWLRAEREAIREKYGVTYGNPNYRFIPDSLIVQRAATVQQSEKWPEAAPYGGNSGRMMRPYLGWVREDAVADFDTWAEKNQ